MVYDVGNRASFDAVEKWSRDIDEVSRDASARTSHAFAIILAGRMMCARWSHGTSRGVV